MAAAFIIHFDNETLAALDRLVEQTKRSRDWLVGRAVEEYLSLNESEITKIKGGIASADRGDFASGEDMERIRHKYARHK